MQMSGGHLLAASSMAATPYNSFFEKELAPNLAGTSCEAKENLVSTIPSKRGFLILTNA